MKRQYCLQLNNRTHSNEIIKDFFLRNGFKLQQEEENKLGFTKESAFWNRTWLRFFFWRSHVIIVRQKDLIYIYSSIDTFWQFLNSKNEKRWHQFLMKLKSEYYGMQVHVHRFNP